jgi:DNA-binding MarR family transcriptional regulator
MSDETYNVRNLNDGDWYWIHKAVIKGYAKKINAAGIAVYNFLASMADGDQKCFPSQKYIADSLGYSRSHVHSTLKSLESNGLIWVEKRKRHRVYHLLKVICQL